VYKKKKRNADRKIRVPDGVDREVDENGVVISEHPRTREAIVKGKRKYTTMYLDDENLYVALKGLGNAGAVWGFVLTKYDKDNNIFHFSGSVKEQCAKITGLSNGTIRSAISSFCEADLLLKIRNAEYMVNPAFFYTGHYELRQQAIDEYEDNKSAKAILESKRSMDNKTVKS